MSDVWLSRRAGAELTAYIRSRGHRLRPVEDDPRFGPGVESHADLRMCKMGPSGPVLRLTGAPYPAYPRGAAMCAVVLEGFVIHRLDITDPGILAYCRERAFREINVRQGYARCSCLPVDGKSVITADPGICAALSRVPELRVLRVSPGHVSLPGFKTGFLGGAAGRVGDEILFNGDLKRHPDFEAIRDFIASRGLGVRFFESFALEDVGSIIEE